jgi:hypothetical protein
LRLLGEINRSHPALPEQLDDAIWTDLNRERPAWTAVRDVRTDFGFRLRLIGAGWHVMVLGGVMKEG